MAYRDLTADEVTFTVTAQQDDAPVRGNALASGDEAEDRRAEDEIIARLDNGDVWAWAQVTVTATDPAAGLTGNTYLGACNYASEADFRTDGYFSDLCDEALAELNAERARLAKALCS